MRPFLTSMRLGLLLAAVALILSWTLVACEGLGDGGGTLPTGTSVVEGDTTSTEVVSTDTLAPTSTVPSPGTTTVPLASSETLLPNGHIKACGIITEVEEDGGGRHLKIDYVDFLTGPEADAAAVADGIIAPGEHVDNDYYARNQNPKLRTFAVSDQVVINTYSRVEPIDVAEPCSWSDFWDFWNIIGPLPPEDEPLQYGLWWIERDGDTIIKIEQQWVP